MWLELGVEYLDQTLIQHLQIWLKNNFVLKLRMIATKSLYKIIIYTSSHKTF